MASLKIQVLGKGLIPRGLGLAPRKELFPADLTLLGTILATSGLTVNYQNPVNNKLEPLTNKNLKQVWDKYSNYQAPAKKEEKTPAPATPTPPAPENTNADPKPGEGPSGDDKEPDTTPDGQGDDKKPDETNTNPAPQTNGTLTPMTQDKNYTNGKKGKK